MNFKRINFCSMIRKEWKSRIFVLFAFFGFFMVYTKYLKNGITVQFVYKDTPAYKEAPVNKNTPPTRHKIQNLKTVSQYKQVRAQVEHFPSIDFNNNFQPEITDKYIILLCDKSKGCGGWGDRQRGIVTVFLLSLVWKRRFGIRITTPCDFRDSFRPTADYDWIITDAEIKGKTVQTINHMGKDEPLRDTNFNASGLADVIFVRTNCYHFMDIVQKYAEFLPHYLQRMSRAWVFRHLWNKIMVPTTRLKVKLGQVLATGKVRAKAVKGEKDLVCAHIRIGNSKFLPFDHVGLPLNSVPKIWKFFEQFKHARMFIATDHGAVRKDAKTRYGNRYIGSYATIMNPDNMRHNKTLACVGQETAYLDQMVLAHCDVLVYYGPSGFSIHATYLKSKWANVFSFKGDTIDPVHLK